MKKLHLILPLLLLSGKGFSQQAAAEYHIRIAPIFRKQNFRVEKRLSEKSS